MQLPFTTVDVFTTMPYAGNPLAIVRVPHTVCATLTEAQKQKIAREFNFSEITFLHEPSSENENGTVDFDIFTPLSRLAFAGHPTIGIALYATMNQGMYPGVRQLKTRAGLIPFEFDEERGRVSVQVPHAVRVHRKRLQHPFPVEEANGSRSETVPLVSIVKGMAFNLVPIRNIEALRLPNRGLLPVAECYLAEHLDQGSGWDVGYTGTFYYTELGVDPKEADVRALRTRSIRTREDPGTGSASCALCGYLAVVARKAGRPRKQRFHLTQGVEMGRRCDIYINIETIEDGEGIESVELNGAAVQVMEGILTIS
jgi:PhzF family phenazine biosynthesis protein